MTVCKARFGSLVTCWLLCLGPTGSTSFGHLNYKWLSGSKIWSKQGAKWVVPRGRVKHWLCFPSSYFDKRWRHKRYCTISEIFRVFQACERFVFYPSINKCWVWLRNLMSWIPSMFQSGWNHHIDRLDKLGKTRQYILHQLRLVVYLIIYKLL